MPRFPLSFRLPVSALLLAACGSGETAEVRRDAPASQPVVVRPAPARATAESRVVDAVAVAPVAPVRTPGSPAVPAGTPAPAGDMEPATPPAPASNEDAAAILQRAERAYSAVRSSEADFVQQLSVPLLGTDQQSRGKIYHRRPDRFAMKFTDPAGDLIVADGTHFWMYYPSTDRTQVIRASMGEAGERMDLQREFLSNSAERYAATLEGRESVGGRPAHVLSLIPRGDSPYQRIRVWVDAEDHLARRFEMTEENGSTRRLELRNLRLNPDLPDALFRFTPPPGTQVFEQ